MDIRVYTVKNTKENLKWITDDEFINLAEKEGNIYSLEDFQKEFNRNYEGDINSDTDIIRFIIYSSKNTCEIKKANEINELDISKKFWELRGYHKEIILHTQTQLCEGEIDYLEAREDLTGDVYDVIPIRVYNDGIEVIDVKRNKRITIGFFNLISIEDQIYLVTLMEKSLKSKLKLQ